ncbi:MAG: phosphatidylserine decarboxylase [Clostridium cadaveris]|uniref:Phosphatidylserine decarboxylase proenzyme n=1 Tax=Clostridium cadaveris TaxID=1529 RepID=A0A316M4A0_9CLOT|nr:phosphatidylserine decarboxylase [Clostridium cadaveris]MDY4950450.1 phosphatidylserine decarboxylase [Clostridium cadaveris]NWK12108.1 phosphatidylserine decarboxylase [Clostridium cadaveris]PWL52089.1 MAG: phosphatidylserine decarboxylase [Clostridium cadaveris]UFH65050.1 phosphatidylserine decarboxylase [Clostridium cadaveris]
MIKIYNRSTKKYEIEKVAGETYLKWCYSSPVGMKFLELFIKKKAFSKLYGKFCDSSLSKRKISSFINDLDIDMSLCEKDIEDFSSFNDFFIRKLKPKARPITNDKNILISPGDGRLTAFSNIDLDRLVQIKGLTYSLKELINNDSVAEDYNGGVCLILRLCPTDYHRFHFVDDGICSETKKIDGSYYSVNPIALEKIPNLFCQNKREWSILKSKNFDDILCMEVGATCVGTIIQTYEPNTEVSKGDEKGYFKFGGSTTVLFLKKDTVEIDKDLLEHSSLGIETQVLMGEGIGRKIL